MDKIYKSIITSLLLLFALISCSPEDYKLNSPNVKSEDLVEGIAFKIEHDKDNPNIVYLTNLLENGYTPVWTHPQGRSLAQKVTLKMPFPGTYEVVFGVETQGGIVYGDTVTFTIDSFYPEFVTDQLWTYLTGGIGKSKVWIHDNGNYGLASGEMDYADPSTTVDWNNFTPNWAPGAGHTSDDQIWNSTMTFSLDGGAFIIAHNESNEGTVDQKGTFMIDTDNHTLTSTDADIIHTQSWGSKATNWSKSLKILTLTENQLQIAVLRDNSAGEDNWWLIWNFVSKEYADNYVPENKPDPVPPIDGSANDVLATTKTKIWTLATEGPYDWADLNGTLIKNFTNKQSYITTGWASYTEDMIVATKFTFTATADNQGKFVFSSFGNADVEGTYSLDEENNIDFGKTLNATISETNFGWVSTIKLSTTAENKLRIVKTKTDVFGTITDMWLGQRLTDKDEYMVYHFKLSSSVEEDKSINIPVDNSKIKVGDLEKNGNLRIEIYNEYGDTQKNPPVDKSKFTFANKLSVTFTINGATLKSGATGSYATAISFASGDWSTQYWGGGEGDTTVTGNGTYTVSFAPTATSTGIQVFTIDAKGIANDLVDLTAISISVDKIEIK